LDWLIEGASVIAAHSHPGTDIQAPGSVSGQTGVVQADPVDTGRRRVRRARGEHRPEPPVLPERSQDDLDVGWGEDAPEPGREAGRDAAWYRRQRPPHYE
jgi:hypothetical protein